MSVLKGDLSFLDAKLALTCDALRWLAMLCDALWWLAMLCDDLRYTAAGFGPSGGKLAGCSMWPLRGWRCRHSSSGLWAPTMRLFLSLGVAGGLALFLLLSCLCRSATLRVCCSLTKHTFYGLYGSSAEVSLLAHSGISCCAAVYAGAPLLKCALYCASWGALSLFPQRE